MLSSDFRIVRCSKCLSRPAALTRFESISPSSAIQSSGIRCMGERVRRIRSPIVSFSMPVRLRFSYQTVMRCGSTRLCQTTYRPSWSNSVPDQHPRRDSTETRDRELDLVRARIRELFYAALQAVDPARAVRDALDVGDGCLIVGDETIRDTSTVHVVAVGKAAVAMTQG